MTNPRPSNSGSNRNLEMLVFEEMGKPEYPEKNLSEQGREPTTNSTHNRIEPGPNCWETSALNTVPSSLPKPTSRRIPRHIQELFKYASGKFERSSEKREINNKENGHKTLLYKLVAVAV